MCNFDLVLLQSISRNFSCQGKIIIFDYFFQIYLNLAQKKVKNGNKYLFYICSVRNKILSSSKKYLFFIRLTYNQYYLILLFT